jgi:hypothetical protein
MLITHEFEWRFTKTRCQSFFGKLLLSDTSNNEYTNTMVGYLPRCELCDGFNVLEGYTMKGRDEIYATSLVLILANYNVIVQM